MYSKHTGNTSLNTEKFKSFALKSGKKTRMVFPYMLNVVSEVLAKTLRQVKGTKGKQIGKVCK